tara:strand:- start:256 stop:1086 length:831 start_codon:yes stop_codon:yes gene_type:complete
MENLVYLGCSLMEYNFIKSKFIREKVFQISLNNPKSRNAINSIMLDELLDCLDNLSRKKEIRVLIITGEGHAFSAGADLEWMKQSINLTLEENKNDAMKFSKMLRKIDEFYCATIAIINGHAFGGGLGILSVCDFKIADSKSKFCFSEVKLGIIPAMIGPYILRNLGYANTKKLFLTGEIFDTKQAATLNLIDMFVNTKHIINERNILIDKLLLGGPKAQTSIKTYLQNIYSKSISDDVIEYAAENIANLRVSEEGQKGIKAFLNKINPDWQNDIS